MLKDISAQVRNNQLHGPNIPLNNPEFFMYNGYKSGLYDWGNAMIENEYKTNYISTSSKLRPLDALGHTVKNGKILAIGIGGSTSGIVFDALENVQAADAGFGRRCSFINCGNNAQDLSNLLSIRTDYWNRVEMKLDSSNYTPLQVQVIFCMEDNMDNLDTSFQRVFDLEKDYDSLLEIIRIQYPNCKLFFIVDRGYSRYSSNAVHTEPIGYLNGWAVKLFISEYTNQLIPSVPVITWLDYYWANGDIPRWDGLYYLPDDFNGIHISPEKSAELTAVTHAKLKIDPGARYWYK